MKLRKRKTLNLTESRSKAFEFLLQIAQACPSEPASYSDRRQKANEGDDWLRTQKGLGLTRIRVYDTGLVKRLNNICTPCSRSTHSPAREGTFYCSTGIKA